MNLRSQDTEQLPLPLRTGNQDNEMASLSSFVFIRVTGPKTLLPKALEDVPCDMEWTWLEFLNRNCNRQFGNLTAKSPFTIRTATRNPKGLGWTANLGDQVKEFINKFTRVRKSFTIRLTKVVSPKRVGNGAPPAPVVPPRTASKRIPSPIENDHVRNDAGNNSPRVPIVVTSPLAKRRAVATIAPTPPSRPFPCVKRTRLVTEHQSKMATSRRISFTTAAQSVLTTKLVKRGNTFWPEDGYLGASNGRNEFDGGLPHDRSNIDAMSDCTSQELEEDELNQDGIRNVEIKPRIIQRLCKNFDNTSMLRIKKELHDLANCPQRWQRLSSRAPRTTHLLQDIFETYAK